MYSIETGGDALGYSVEMRQDDNVLLQEYYFWAFQDDGIQPYKQNGNPSYVGLFFQSHLQPDAADQVLRKYVRHQVNTWRDSLEDQGIEAHVIDNLELF